MSGLAQLRRVGWEVGFFTIWIHFKSELRERVPCRCYAACNRRERGMTDLITTDAVWTRRFSYPLGSSFGILVTSDWSTSPFGLLVTAGSTETLGASDAKRWSRLFSAAERRLAGAWWVVEEIQQATENLISVSPYVSQSSQKTGSFEDSEETAAFWNDPETIAAIEKIECAIGKRAAYKKKTQGDDVLSFSLGLGLSSQSQESDRGWEDILNVSRQFSTDNRDDHDGSITQLSKQKKERETLEKEKVKVTEKQKEKEIEREDVSRQFPQAPVGEDHPSTEELVFEDVVAFLNQTDEELERKLKERQDKDREEKETEMREREENERKQKESEEIKRRKNSEDLERKKKLREDKEREERDKKETEVKERKERQEREKRKREEKEREEREEKERQKKRREENEREKKEREEKQEKKRKEEEERDQKQREEKEIQQKEREQKERDEKDRQERERRKREKTK
ncbi:stress response protein NST1 [Striga asiatica]|uniref:Stress response protein NST1 n=1 Tax=Striga asiatica TaxID=4170 RepID=A0A5A7QLH7_STRAF|nr:stress response protein NST1 [Striga asiatica]